MFSLSHVSLARAMHIAYEGLNKYRYFNDVVK